MTQVVLINSIAVMAFCINQYRMIETGSFDLCTWINVFTTAM